MTFRKLNILIVVVSLMSGMAYATDVTYQVRMSLQLEQGNFDPDAGDIVVVRGTMNGWAGNDFTLEAVEDDEHLSMTGTFDLEDGDHDYHYVIVHEEGEDYMELDEKLDQNYENWTGGSLDEEFFRSEPNSLKCETNGQHIDSPNFSVTEGSSYLINFWYFDAEGAAGHHGEYYFFDGDGSELRHAWVLANQAEDWRKLAYLITAESTGDRAKLRLTADDDETIYFDDMSINEVRGFQVEGEALELNPVWFNNVEPEGFSSVTFQVKMSYQARLGLFDPDAGDIVVVRGKMNRWSGSDYRLHAVPNDENLLMRGTFVLPEGEQSYHYAIVHQEGEVDIELDEIIDPEYGNWNGGSIDSVLFRSEPTSLKCETNGQQIDSPNFSVVEGNHYLLNFWYLDTEGQDGHHGEYYFYDGDGSEIRHGWVTANQAENWSKLNFAAIPGVTGDLGSIRLTADDDETINFDDMSVNRIRGYSLGDDALVLNPVWFDHTPPPPTYRVTFNLWMDFQMQLGVFDPDAGDRISIRGTWNNFSGNDYRVGRFEGDENSLFRGTHSIESGDYDYYYVIVREDGEEVSEIFELMDQDLRNWRGGSLDPDIFRSLSHSRKCETNAQRINSPNFSVEAGRAYMFDFWYYDPNGEGGHHAEFTFYNGDRSELRHAWRRAHQAGEWMNAHYVIRPTVSGDFARVRFEPDDDETIYFDDMSLNNPRTLSVGEENMVIDHVWFNDRARIDIANVDVLFMVDMSVAIEGGMFDPDSDAVIIRGAHEKLGNWGGFHSLSQIGQGGSYATWIQFEDTPIDTAIEFKFAIDTSDGQSDAVIYEDLPRGGNRMVARSGNEEDSDMNGYFEVMTNIEFWGNNPGNIERDVTLHLQLDAHPAFAKFADVGIAGIDTIRGFWVAGLGNAVGWNWGALPDEARLNDEGIAPDQNAGDMIYGVSILFPAMSPKVLGYQYGVNMRNNEAMYNENHVILLDDQEGEMTVRDIFGATGHLYDDYMSVQPIDRVELPIKFDVSQNFPNPFNGKTSISFDLNIPSDVTVKVFDLTGAEVMVHKTGNLSAGSYQINVDFTAFSSGTYIYRVEAGEFSVSKKMMLLK